MTQPAVINQARCGRKFWRSSADGIFELDPWTPNVYGESTQSGFSIENYDGDYVCNTGKTEVLRVTREIFLGGNAIAAQGANHYIPYWVCDLTYDSTSQIWAGQNSDWSHLGTDYTSDATVYMEAWQTIVGAYGNKVFSVRMSSDNTNWWGLCKGCTIYNAGFRDYYFPSPNVRKYTGSPVSTSNFPIDFEQVGPQTNPYQWPSFFFTLPQVWRLDLPAPIVGTDGTNTYTSATSYTLQTKWATTTADCTSEGGYCTSLTGYELWPLATDFNTQYVHGRHFVNDGCYCHAEGELMNIEMPNVGNAYTIFFTHGPGRIFQGSANAVWYNKQKPGWFYNRYGTSRLMLHDQLQGGVPWPPSWLVSAPEYVEFTYVTDTT